MLDMKVDNPQEKNVTTIVPDYQFEHEKEHEKSMNDSSSRSEEDRWMDGKLTPAYTNPAIRYLRGN